MALRDLNRGWRRGGRDLVSDGPLLADRVGVAPDKLTLSALPAFIAGEVSASPGFAVEIFVNEM